MKVLKQRHFSVADKNGNVVSSTYTLNSTFGSGVVIKGTGILMNNEMDDFSALQEYLISLAYWALRLIKFRQVKDL